MKSRWIVSHHAVATLILAMANVTVHAAKNSWTDKDAEWYWKMVVDDETRTSTSQRFDEANEEEGEGILETFGTQYLPNAYAFYQETRATAKEREQVLRENFPNGRASDDTGGSLYDKIQKACSKAIAEMFRRHDEICHFFLLHKTGVITDRDLANLDTTKILIVLPETGSTPMPYFGSPVSFASSDKDFATKYLPESCEAFQKLDNLYSEGVKFYMELREKAILIDAIRSNPIFTSLQQRLDAINGKKNDIANTVKQTKLLHAVGEKTASDLVDVDHKLGIEVQQFVKTLSVATWVRKGIRLEVEKAKRHRDPVAFAIRDMVQIPGKDYKMGKFEVTRALWQTVMWNANPSTITDPDIPVSIGSLGAAQAFLREINAIPSVQASGLTFRLPTQAEWLYACRAGGSFCKLANGTEVTRETYNEVAWCEKNSGGRVHEVGQKKPNEFGLYDMFGNVGEIIGDVRYQYEIAYCGSSWDDEYGFFDDQKNQHWCVQEQFNGGRVGIRLCATVANSPIETSDDEE